MFFHLRRSYSKPSFTSKLPYLSIPSGVYLGSGGSPLTEAPISTAVISSSSSHQPRVYSPFPFPSPPRIRAPPL
ncbi:hypothetical protein SLA2020_210210 [Shorea laevis]